jgi:hypothetical protein
VVYDDTGVLWYKMIRSIMVYDDTEALWYMMIQEPKAIVCSILSGRGK